jgi:hypothetical protein
MDIDADLEHMGRDADFQRKAAQIMAEFAQADAETARMLDDEHGPYPYDETELAELSRLARGPR